MKNVLLINAHQIYEGISPGQLNKTMARIIKEEMEKRGCKAFWRMTAGREKTRINSTVQAARCRVSSTCCL